MGSGKTATDACVWLLGRGVDPDRICWVRPRDPWMLNRSMIQPDPTTYLGMVAEMMRLAAGAGSLPELFEQLEEAEIMLRIDPSVTPTNGQGAHAGPLGARPAPQHRTCCAARPPPDGPRGGIDLEDGSVAVADDALV